VSSATREWWSALPVNQLAYVVGSTAEQIRTALDPLPPQAPAVIFVWPSVVRPFSEQVLWLLDEMDRVALRLFEQWLPGAAKLDDASPMAIAAAGALAQHLADQSPHYRSFIVDLAKRALTTKFATKMAESHVFAAEVRGAGLVRALTAAYGRSGLAVLVEVPGGLTKPQQRSLVAAATWICDHSAAAVWFAGAPLDQVDTLLAIPIVLGDSAEQATSELGEVLVTEPVLVFPAIAGQPRADSDAELALENELRHHQWAAERRWNHPYHIPGATSRYRLDLLWEAAKLVVEVDGKDHWTKAKYATDRVRDVVLALDGYQVVRFTNDLVLGDVKTVVGQIKQLLCIQQGRNRTAQEAKR
jgi:very-short-patch-repair endonuclease